MIGGAVRGASQIIAKIRALAKQFPDDVSKALYQEAQIEMTESKKRCPVSPTPAPKGVVPGTLRASGTVWPPQREGTRIFVMLSYGGAADAYAVPQHERTDYHHTTGQCFYLSSVLNESRPHMLARIGARVHLNKART